MAADHAQGEVTGQTLTVTTPGSQATVHVITGSSFSTWPTHVGWNGYHPTPGIIENVFFFPFLEVALSQQDLLSRGAS